MIQSQGLLLLLSPPAAESAAFSFDLQRTLSGLTVAGTELVLLALVCCALYALAIFILSRMVAQNESLAKWTATAKIKARNLLRTGFLLLAIGILAFNGWLIARGLDAKSHTIALLRSINAEWRMAIGMALGKLALSAIGLVIATRLMRRLLQSAERAINRWDRLAGNDQSLAMLFTGLNRVMVNTAWLLLAVFACAWFSIPQSVSDMLLVILRVYLVISIGILFIRCTTVIVDTLEGFSERSARDRGWAHYYDQLRPLVPTFRACLEYALWIVVASLVLLQIRPLGYLAVWGPRLIQAIGIFFIGRVVIQLGFLEIGNRMLPQEGLEETDRQRRETMVPLVRSTFMYAVYFGTVVLMLSALGFNPMPFLAGAGILGVVVGFGAQSMIDDVVSGFFILFENTYLVGDTIEIPAEAGNTRGVVEAIEFRTTKIRDADGRLHILRNGQIKPIINYSKDYTKAVVAVEVGYDADLRAVFSTLHQAGERLRADNPHVLADLEIDGIIAFGESTMTVRTSTRVKPGRHETVAAALRFLIKETFDRQAPGAPRKTLIPEIHEDHEAPAAARQGAS